MSEPLDARGETQCASGIEREGKTSMSFPIHDHFDGSAHCRECGGPCRLTGAERAYTQLVNAVIESITVNQVPVNMRIQGALRDAGVPIEAFLRRASKSLGKEADARP